MISSIECGQRARDLVCDLCAYPKNLPVEWGGFSETGQQQWFHVRKVPFESNPPTFLDRLLARFGLHRRQEDPGTHTLTTLCPASRIIQAFQLIDVPRALVHTWKRGGQAVPYDDPALAEDRQRQTDIPQTPAGGKE